VSGHISQFHGLNFDYATSTNTFNYTNEILTVIGLFIVQLFAAL